MNLELNTKVSKEEEIINKAKEFVISNERIKELLSYYGLTFKDVAIAVEAKGKDINFTPNYYINNDCLFTLMYDVLENCFIGHLVSFVHAKIRVS